MEIKDNKIYLAKEDFPENHKLVTGTRFGAVLGLNAYSTPFQSWCEIQKIWAPSFEDTIYTLAGKTIEPKQAEYVAQKYPELSIVYPKDLFGEDYFNKTRGNFFTDPHFGGMWDYLGKKDVTTACVFEMKTAGKSKMKDWAGNKIPESYALQASLYAYLLGTDKAIMVATFLNQKNGDYEHPEDFIVTDENTIIKEFSVSERYPNFKTDYIDKVINWWNVYIETGVSPEWDNIRDAEIIHDILNKPDLNIIPTTTSDTIQLDTIIKSNTETLDKLLRDIDFDIEMKSINCTARNYYFKLPLEIYNISCNIKDLDNQQAKNEINTILNLAKQKVALLENYI